MGNFCDGLNQQKISRNSYSKKVPLFEFPQPYNITKYITVNSLNIRDQPIYNSQNKFKSFLNSLNNTQFTDPEFQLTKNQSVRLIKIQNSKKFLNQPLFIKSSSSNVIQLNKEYCYISVVFCFIADYQQIQKQLILTSVNQNGFYVVKLHPNGKPQEIVVDDKLPFNSDLLYSSTKKFEPWVYILEKAWVKMIGSYKKAQGLSPQDALEQILGIPTYSYQLYYFQPSQIEKQLKSFLKNEKCIIFTAKRDPQILEGLMFQRQVFYLKSIKQLKGEEYFHLRSPYEKFGLIQDNRISVKLKNQVQDFMINNPGDILLTKKELWDYFEYCTIGLYQKDFILSHKEICSDPFSSMYFQFTIISKMTINMRIIQFYEGYLSNNTNYEYSPVFIKLYDQLNKTIIAQGCKRSTTGVKSSNIFEELFTQLLPGKYLLNIQINWLFEGKINVASLVTYAPEKLEIKQIPHNEGQRRSYLIDRSCLQKQQKKEMHGLNYGSKWLKNGVMILIQNTTDKKMKLRINLKNSHNLIPLKSDWNSSKKCLDIELEGHDSQLIQLRKQNGDSNSYLGAYTFQILTQHQSK